MSVTSLRGKRRKTACAGCLFIIKNKSLKGESKTLKYFTVTQFLKKEKTL